jgi:diguanylate cyclase (GGDEF)-like protein
MAESLRHQLADLLDTGETATISFECYMPRLQFWVRMLFGVLAATYFLYLPEPLILFDLTGILAILVLFFGFHIVWWCVFKYRGMGVWGIRLAVFFDIAGSFIAILNDPFPTPPTGSFLLAASLGNGIQHGLRLFQEQIFLIVILLFPVFAIRQYIVGAVPYSLVFAVIFLAICLFYAYILVSRIEALRKEAETLAEQDPLTGIYNRNAFVRAAEYLLSLNERQQMTLTVMFADLDDFKNVNDTLGHVVGDEVLIHFARLTGILLRKSDVVARYGGDEFVFVLANMSAREAEQAAIRLQREFLKWTSDQGIRVGVSFGIMEVSKRKNRLDDLLRQVDVALYQAKKDKGRSRIVIAPSL